MSEIEKKLLEVQGKLKAPKNQFNAFGKYKYRSCEDILEAVKPICIDKGLLLTLSDDVINVGPFNYVKATASVHYGEESMMSTAMAREAIEKKGMDASQITGAASSYARKYALNGLFCIDDNKDNDDVSATTIAAGKTAVKTGPDTDLSDAIKVTGYKAKDWADMLKWMKADDRIKNAIGRTGKPVIEGVKQWEDNGREAKDICGQMIKYFAEEK